MKNEAASAAFHLMLRNMFIPWVHWPRHDAILQRRRIEAMASAQPSLWIAVGLRPQIIHVIATTLKVF